MHVRGLANCIEVQAPAKLNLFLELLGKRSDGYHEIETLIVGIQIFDTLIFAPRTTGEIDLTCRWAAANGEKDRTIYGDIPLGSQNLVWRALEQLRKEVGINKGASVLLVKRIPAAAGLGGGSSDAAAALVAANIGWQLNLPPERLAAIAAKIGSDVPFFLAAGGAICRGRGEQIEGIIARRLHTVVVRPPIGIATRDVYEKCRVADQRAAVDPIRSALVRGAPQEVAEAMTNRLQPAAAGITPWIDELKNRMQFEAVLGHQMSGSGSSYFGICRSARNARRVAARLRARRCGAVFAATTTAATR
jgi:4-diphosphocytidyl-2-C-methyl-D-erythritol kinase